MTQRLIEEEWNEYRNVFLPSDVPYQALKDMRRIFYAGAVSVTASLLLKSKESPEVVQSFIDESNEWQQLAAEGLV